MLNEGKGISDVVKENVDEIWNLFLNNSYSTHIYKFGNERLKYKDLTIKFNHINNYYSNITIDKLNLLLNNSYGCIDYDDEKNIIFISNEYMENYTKLMDEPSNEVEFNN